MDQNERIATIIREYDAQGWHRTGTTVDHESARWLVGKARELGLNADLEPFKLNRIDPGLCYLEVDGERIEGLPMYDGTFTGPEGIHGRIGPVGSSAEIGFSEVVSEQAARVYHGSEALEAARRASVHAGLVVINVGGRPGLMASNAPGFWDPFGPPVLQVSSETRTLFSEHARRHTQVHLVVSASRTDAESFNVVGRLKGSDESLPPIAVMTPRSGWWHCAGERGGGLACWLEVMRATCETGSPRDVIFVATSAHELRSYGADAFLERHPDWINNVSTWIHFGANIGAAQEPAARFSANDDELERQVSEALRRAGIHSATAAPRGTTVGLESQVVARRGGRVVATVGGNALFHLESDRWPEAVEVEAVARFANAYSDVARSLAGS